ncbi:MAG: hypothetical protein OXC46_07305 [Thaumarchaeota archaeon]|nr:hypothetical protein [Nitrososphaerota archaeon]
MAKQDLKNMLEESKKELGADCQNFKDAINNDVQSFKKKALEKI